MAPASLSCLVCTLRSFFIALSLLVQYLFLSSCTGRGNPRLLTAAPHDHHPSLMLWPKLSPAEEHCYGSSAPFMDPHTSAINLQKVRVWSCQVFLSWYPLIGQINLIFFLFISAVSSSLSWLFQRKQNVWQEWRFQPLFLSNTLIIPKYFPVCTTHVKITHCVIFKLQSLLGTCICVAFFTRSSPHWTCF